MFLAQHLGKIAALTNLFSKSQKWTFWKEFALILIASTTNSYLGTVQKHQELASIRYPQKLMLSTHPWPHKLFWLFVVVVRFLTYLMTSSMRTWGNDLKCTLIGNLHSSVTSGENLRSIGRQMRQGASLSLYLWEVRSPLLVIPIANHIWS